jgi:hypothetical protein
LIFLFKVLFINFLSVHSLSILIIENLLLNNLHKTGKSIIERRTLLLLDEFMEAQLNHSDSDEVIICQFSLQLVYLIMSIDLAKVASLRVLEIEVDH